MTELSTDLLDAARDLYEGTHGMTMARLAEITNIPLRTLRLRARDEDWAKKLETKTGATTAEAVDAAKMFEERSTQAVDIAEETNEAVKIIGETLPSEREELLQRHRQEWSAPRAMSIEAVRLRDQDPIRAMERARLAKITAETLKLVQDGERKAHGLDVGVDVPQGHVVVIERA